ncbi:hypothetical protein FGIG_07138 [Fasciola gigantica]|uniref:Uncharacterized protein n=1 Tax=Fasciola gigantica TaxID=46835 RepID=A0A504YUS1_FASGI|nr:hypothetical protein FGIG_07138 [Fasciola gigantica]
MYRPNRRYLPREFCDLMGTPRTTMVCQIHPGTYCHIGLQSAFNEIPPNVLQEEITTIGIQLHVDGLQPFGSSKTRVRTMLERVACPTMPTLFEVKVYCGSKQPTDVNAFLEDLMRDLAEVQRNGIKLNGFQNSKQVQMTVVIYDHPARYFFHCYTMSTKYNLL